MFAPNTEADITSDLDNYVSYNKSIINYVNHRLHKYTFFCRGQKIKNRLHCFFWNLSTKTSVWNLQVG